MARRPTTRWLGAGAAIFTAGSNADGQLGDGTVINSPVFIRNQAPLPVQLTAFTATADAGGTAALALPAGLAPGVYMVRAGGSATRLVVE